MSPVLKIIMITILIAGAFMSLFPILPGIPIIFGVFVAYGFIDGFQHITPLFLILMLIVTIASYLIDNFAAWWGAKKYGASRVGAWGAIIGGLAGIFINPLLGIILGPFFGAIIAEIIFSHRSLRDAFRVGIGTLVGFAGGSLIRFIIALFMIIVFLSYIY